MAAADRPNLARMVAPSVVFGVVVTVLLLACDSEGGSRDSDRDPSTSFREYDSAGIWISETAGSRARAAVGGEWAVAAEPDLQIGNAEGALEHQFYNVVAGGVAGLNDGGIAVVDAGAPQIRIFDGDGSFRAAWGRRGDGPSELRSATLVPSMAYDSLLLYDRDRKRFLLVAGDATGYRPLLTGMAPDVSDGFPLWATDECLLQVKLIIPPINDRELTADFVWEVNLVNVAESSSATLGRFTWPRVIARDELGRRSMIDLPFYSEPSAVANEISIFTIAEDGLDIRVWTHEGSLTRIIRLDERARRILPSEVDAALEAAIASTAISSWLAPNRRQAQVPEAWPTFRRLLMDRLGVLWAELHPASSGAISEWMVFDDSGGARGVVSMPEGLEVREIGLDYILGIWRDPLGVQYVRRHALRRPLD